ncbi:MAG TPA: type II toxin-antitoxin system RelE/ParE family toxin [Flavobacteriales bacterium]|nr:type II toxin-antitoxin system RelE/ParE family toxin [Flavobacteriales bacterium]
MKVVFQPFAYQRLGEIIFYLSEHNGEGYAVDLAERIVQRTLELEVNPRLGAVEPLIKDPTREYRRLVEGHYKIIYWIAEHDVRIADIFDSRRDPSEMLGQ